MRDGLVQRRTVFLHFVDDEIYARISASRPEPMGLLDGLIKLLVLCCPEPPVFPISARHELEDMAALSDRLDPLLSDGRLAVMGAGSTPQIYLERRRVHYGPERQTLPRLFASTEDAAIAPLGSVWIAKSGDSTADIRRAWQSNVLGHRGGLLKAIRHVGQGLPDRTIDRLLTLPDRAADRPLIPSVVLAQLAAERMIDAPVARWVEDELTCFLGSEWVRVYADDIGVAVLSDLGIGLPNPRGFLPPDARWLFSPMRAQHALARLGVAKYINVLGFDEWAALLRRIEPTRGQFADDLFERTRPSEWAIWTDDERALLLAFDSRCRRTAIPVRYAVRILGRHRAEVEIERRVEIYCGLLANRYSMRKVTTMSVDKSINVGSVSGDAQIASGDGSVQIGSAGRSIASDEFVRMLMVALIEASRSDSAADHVLTLVLDDPLAGSRDADQIAAATRETLDQESLSEGGRGRLRALSAKLGTHAGQTAVGAGVLAALRAAGLGP